MSFLGLLWSQSNMVFCGVCCGMVPKPVKNHRCVHVGCSVALTRSACVWIWSFPSRAAATMEQYQLVQKHSADSSSLVDVGTTVDNNSCLGSAANHDFAIDRCWQHECTNRKTARPCLRFLLSQDPKAQAFEASKPLISKY